MIFNMASDYKKAEDILPIISSVNEVLSTSNDCQQLLDMALDTILDVLEIDCCWVQLFRLENRSLYLAACSGFTPDMEQEIDSMEPGQSLGNNVAGLELKIIIPDLSRDKEYGLSSFSKAGLCSLVAVPLRTYRMQGVMGIASRVKNRFHTEVTELLTVIASLVGVALDKAELHQRTLAEEKKVSIGTLSSVTLSPGKGDIHQDLVDESEKVIDTDREDAGVIEQEELHPTDNEGRINGLSATQTRSEYKLLDYLMTNEGRVISYEELLTEVWGNEYRDFRAFLKIHIEHLKHKLNDSIGSSRSIIDESDTGYRFVRIPEET